MKIVTLVKCKKLHWMSHTHRESNSFVLPPTRKEKRWMGKEQLQAIHAAGVGKRRLLLTNAKSQSNSKEPWCALEETGGQRRSQGAIRNDDDDTYLRPT